jgi:RNA recognition motif-containing protein
MARKKLYVGNLPFSTTEQQLREAFEQFGEISDVHMPKDRDSGDFRGFAFVEFADAQSADDATNALNETDFNGRTLRINEARPREDRGGRGGGRNHEGRHFSDRSHGNR